MSVLTHANREWESRPADERFPSLEAMHAVALKHRHGSTQATVPYRELNAIVGSRGDAIMLDGIGKKPVRLSNWAYTQLTNKIGAPANYLRTLPTDVAVQCLNAGIANLPAVVEKAEADQPLSPAKKAWATMRAAKGITDDSSRAMVLMNGNRVRGITSEIYSRIWNADLTEKLMELEGSGPWQPAPAAFDGSRGLYLGDRDMFAFMVDNNRRIFEKGPGGGLSRGFFLWNSEVGARSIGVATFLYEYICGNHRVWGVSEIAEMRIAHIFTDLDKAFGKLAVQLRTYAETSAEEDEAKVKAARNYEIAATKEDVIAAVFKLAVGGLGKGRINEAYDLAEQRVDWYGSPRSAWGLAGGLTEIARDLPNADERTTLDRAATKVMDMALN